MVSVGAERRTVQDKVLYSSLWMTQNLRISNISILINTGSPESESREEQAVESMIFCKVKDSRSLDKPYRIAL